MSTEQAAEGKNETMDGSDLHLGSIEETVKGGMAMILFGFGFGFDDFTIH